MTRSEYQDLVEFIGPKFDRIERRFEAIDLRFDAVEERLTGVEERLTGVEARLTGIDARLTRVEVTVEENRHLIQVVAESVTSLREEMARGFSAQAKRIDGLDARVDRWEGRSA